MILISDIQFVIVLYKCKLQDSVTFLSLSEAMEKNHRLHKADLYIYDNTPYEQDNLIKSQYWNIETKSDLLNSGLSVAYNSAALHAKNSNKKYILLLDQDTDFPLNSIEVYLQSINNNIDIKLFAPILKIENGKIMSPCRYVKKWGKLIDHVPLGELSLNKYVPVNSGLCISLNEYFDAGGYNEKILVDGADFQFIERFKKKIGTSLYVLNLEIAQNFSLFETDFQNILLRFKIFLTDVKNFDRNNWVDNFYYGRVALIRTIKLFMQTRKKIIFDYYIKYYL